MSARSVNQMNISNDTIFSVMVVGQLVEAVKGKENRVNILLRTINESKFDAAPRVLHEAHV
jgi:hypothetical protein